MADGKITVINTTISRIKVQISANGSGTGTSGFVTSGFVQPNAARTFDVKGYDLYQLGFMGDSTDYEHGYIWTTNVPVPTNVTISATVQKSTADAADVE